MRKIIFFTAILSVFLSNSSCEQNRTSESKKGGDSTTTLSAKEHVIPEIPSQISYCDEVIMLDNFDIRERLDRELIINTHYHSSTIQILKRANRYFPEIESALKDAGLPDDLKYVAVIESALAQATSPSGAKGFWQFMPETGLEFGLTINDEVDERLDVYKSTLAATQYLKRAHIKFGDWILASASYNCGMAGLERQLENQQQTDFFSLYLNKETSRYVFRILALKLIMENPQDYGYSLEEDDLYQPVATKSIEVSENISDLNQWAIEHKTNLRLVKVLNPWLISNELKADKIYQIKIPA